MKTQIKYFLMTLPIAAALILIFRLFFPAQVFTVGNWSIPFGVAVVLLIMFFMTDRFILSLITKRKLVHERELITFWSELARPTGLTCNREGVSVPWSGASAQPGISGLFNGRHVSIDLFSTTGDRDASVPARLFSRIVLQIKNRADCSLTVRRRVGTDRKGNALAAGTSGLDKRCHIAGSPDGFVTKAIQLMIQRASFFIQKPPGRVLFSSHTMLWSPGWLPPSIQLSGSELICTQHGVPTDVPHQIALLELLCRLADSAEATEKGQITEVPSE